MASSRSGTPGGSRLSAGPAGLLWLAALMFGLLYTHAVSAETTASHLSAHAVVRTAPTDHRAPAPPGTHHAPVSPGTHHAPVSPGTHHDAAPGPHHDGQEPHPAGQCVSGQPQQGHVLPAPAPAGLGGAAACSGLLAAKPAPQSPRAVHPEWRSSMGSVVLRI
ncbi:hypothetical protein [Streptomyces sp. NPDC047928]